MTTTAKRMLVLAAGALLASAGCSIGAPENDHVLRIAMGSPGEAQIRVWDDVAKQFEAAHPDTKVELNYQDDDLYQTIGLQNLLAGRNAPDIYFEWTGARLEQRNKDGYAADLTEAFKSGPLAGLFDDATLSQYTIDGKVVMVPYSADVTNVMWFNKKILADANVAPPTILGRAARGVRHARAAAGVIADRIGQQGPVAGRQLAGPPRLARRRRGRLRRPRSAGPRKFATPEWEKAFGYVKELADHKCVNDSANAIDDNEGAQLFFQEKAAMHPIGSWLVSWAIDENPDLDFDYVNLPAMPDGAGDQGSVIGVATGYSASMPRAPSSRRRPSSWLCSTARRISRRSSRRRSRRWPSPQRRVIRPTRARRR